MKCGNGTRERSDLFKPARHGGSCTAKKESEKCNLDPCQAEGRGGGSSAWPIVLLVILILIILVLLGLFYLWRRKNKSGKNVVELKNISDDSELRKDGQLKEKLCNLTDDVNKLYDEFKTIETEAKEEALTKTTMAAEEEGNKGHNRYSDIGRYRDIFIKL